MSYSQEDFYHSNPQNLDVGDIIKNRDQIYFIRQQKRARLPKRFDFAERDDRKQQTS